MYSRLPIYSGYLWWSSFVLVNRSWTFLYANRFYSEEKGALDESDQFLLNPAGFATEFAKNWSIPSHIVLFDSQEKLLKDFLALHNFQEVAFLSSHSASKQFIFSFFFHLSIFVWLSDWQIKRFFHAHFKVDRELQASVAVYALKGQWFCPWWAK